MNSETFKTADLRDEFPENSENLSARQPIFRRFGKKRRFSGPVFTVKVHEDDALVREALETLPEGAVLVADGGSSKKRALLGEKPAAIAADRRLSGVVVSAGDLLKERP